MATGDGMDVLARVNNAAATTAGNHPCLRHGCPAQAPYWRGHSRTPSSPRRSLSTASIHAAPTSRPLHWGGR